jgi:hypothetical protein
MTQLYESLASLNASPDQRFGEDLDTGQGVEQRYQWVLDRMGALSEIFTINICPRTALSDHNRAVANRALELTEKHVIKQWRRSDQVHLLIKRGKVHPSQRDKAQTPEWYRHAVTWVHLVKRVFNIDVLIRPKCANHQQDSILRPVNSAFVNHLSEASANQGSIAITVYLHNNWAKRIAQ